MDTENDEMENLKKLRTGLNEFFRKYLTLEYMSILFLLPYQWLL